MTSDQILVVNSDACLRDDTNAGQVWAQNSTMLARLQNVTNFAAGA